MTELETYALGGALLGAVATLFGIIYAVYYVIRALAEWKIFTKAGEKGWKSLIPIYNVYTECKLTTKKNIFVPYIVLTLLAGLLQEYTGDAFIIVALGKIVNILVFAVTYYRWKYLAKAFGKGKGFTFGLLLVNPIFIMILGLGEAKYLGVSEE